MSTAYPHIYLFLSSSFFHWLLTILQMRTLRPERARIWFTPSVSDSQRRVQVSSLPCKLFLLYSNVVGLGCRNLLHPCSILQGAMLTSILQIRKGSSESSRNLPKVTDAGLGCQRSHNWSSSGPPRLAPCQWV